MAKRKKRDREGVEASSIPDTSPGEIGLSEMGGGGSGIGEASISSTSNGGGDRDGEGESPLEHPDRDVEALAQSEEALIKALIRRGKDKDRKGIVYTREQEDELVQKIVQDFEDASAGLTEFKRNHEEYLSVWRGVLEQKEPPFEGAANIHVPLSSSFAEQMKARFYKAVLGGETYALFSCLDESVKQVDLNEINTWFQWEMDEVVEIKKIFADICHDLMIDGISLPVASYEHRTRFVQSMRDFEIRDGVSLQDQMIAAIDTIFEGENPSPTTIGLGRYKVEHQSREVGNAEALVNFCISEDENLTAEIERLEIIFDGGQVERFNIENLVVVNSHPDPEKLPFLGNRLWVSVFDFINSGDYRKFKKEEEEEIVAHANAKIEETVEQRSTDLADREEGTESKDVAGVDYSRRWLEVYRWEGNWSFSSKDDLLGRSIYDTTGYVVWTALGSKRIVKIERLDDLTIDGGKTPIKFDFILDPDRFFSIGLIEWLKHVQAEMDGIHNQRLDAGTLANVPFGFYEPSAGLSQNVLKWKPGHMYPTKNAAGISFPKMNWQPFWSFEEEKGVKLYAQEQAGMGDPAIGAFASKRTTAAEFTGTSASIDLRTEFMADRIFRSFRKLLTRLFSLYQRYAKDGRIFQVSGSNGERIVKKLKKDWLQGKLTLHLTANVQQLSSQLQRDIAVEMLSLLLNPLLINMGVVKPDTIYDAIDRVAKTSGYRGVVLHRPDVPEDSPPPDTEHKMMMIGETVQPHPNENFQEHLSVHMQFASMPNIMDYLPSVESRQALATHIQQTTIMQRAVNIMRQQQAVEAAGMRDQMERIGIRPGKAGGSKPGDQAEPGTQEEGVQGGPTE